MVIVYRHYSETVEYCGRSALNWKNCVKTLCKNSYWAPGCYRGSVGHGGRLLRNIFPDKMGSRDAECYRHAMDLIPGYR